MYKTNEKLHQIDFKHLPKGFDITDKTAVYRFFDDLCSAKPVNIEELKLLILKYSDVIMAMEDELAWRYIRMTLNADNEDYENRYNEYFSEIYAPLQERQFQIKKLMYDSPYRNKLAVDEYQHLIEIIENDIKLFREENIPLIIQESELANKYGGIVSQMSVFFDDEEKTPAKLSVYLKDKDRKVREQAWRLLRGLYMDKAEDLDKLYDELAQLRYAIAQNTGFENYRDYKHQSMGRFSYTPEDIYAFHDAVEKEVIPFIKELDEHRRQCLGVDTLRPWILR
jgi:oligoendopeptidase F